MASPASAKEVGCQQCSYHHLFLLLLYPSQPRGLYGWSIISNGLCVFLVDLPENVVPVPLAVFFIVKLVLRPAFVIKGTYQCANGTGTVAYYMQVHITE